MVPATPSRQSAEELCVGDAVDVPGGMTGTVRFVGTVQGKKGTFAGVELHQDFAARGKNNGDVEGYVSFGMFPFSPSPFLFHPSPLKRMTLTLEIFW
jgi:hypothetical protein